jgi:FkbM family methyltransferase
MEGVMIHEVIRFADVLRFPEARRACRSWKPFSIASFSLVFGLKKYGLRFGTVIDGGANVGQFARAACELFPEAEIHSFEPQAETADAFRANLVDAPRVRLHEKAIGNYDGMIKFYTHSYSQASSALAVCDDHLNKNKCDRQLGETEVPIVRLDTFLAGADLPDPILLKLDVQGFELEALKGAERLLRRCHSVLTETVFRPSYEGEPLFEDLQAYLKAQGFSFTGPLGFLRDSENTICEMDALFQRSVVE